MSILILYHKGVIIVKKRPDGRYQLSVTLKNPITDETKRVYAYGKTVREATLEKQRLQREWQAHWQAATGDNFGEYCRNLFSEKLKDGAIRQSTAKTYEQVLRQYILPQLPDACPVSAVTTPRIKYLLSVIPSGARRKSVYTVLHGVLQEAVFEGIIDANPCARVRPPRHTATPAAVITPEQYAALMQAVRGRQAWYVFFLAFETGMRRGELCALTWDKIVGNTVTVSASMANDKTVGKPKTAYGNRIIAISPACVKVLEEWKRRLRRRLMSFGLPWQEDGFVFRGSQDMSKPLPPNSVTQMMSRACKTAGLPPRTCLHSLRHTHATMIASLDLSPKKIQARLGHSNAAFTLDHYVHKDNMDNGVIEAIKQIEQAYHVATC